jgi:hypothetical protein
VSVVVEVSARKFMVPRECACCGAAAQVEVAATHTRTTGVRVIREDTRSLMFPYCNGCDRHSKLWASAASLAEMIFWLGIGVGIVAAFGAGLVAGMVCMAVGVMLAVGAYVHTRSQAQRMCGANCGSPSAAVVHLGWSGSVSSFAFHSTRYAVSFAAGNGEKLINVSMELQRLLVARTAELQHKVESPRQNPTPIARHAPPSLPAAPPMLAEAEPRTPGLGFQGAVVVDWIARIESYKGAEARRNALARALEEIADPRERCQLVLAASRIETAAVLDRVDGLATAAAKKRHLEKAIAELRSDDVPDELQAEQLRELESRLRELG